MEPDITILDAMLSPIVPLSHHAEKEAKMEDMKKEMALKADTQILLEIFEKVVRIEDHMCKGGGAAPDPNVFGTNPVQLEL